MIIALTGKQRAGKDTVAEYLVKNYGFTRMSLAGPVYDLARDLFGMKEKDRGLLIAIGMSMRQIDPLVWVKKLWRSIEESGAENIVIPDVRFLNEYEFFASKGARIVRVNASKEVRASRKGYTPEHESDVTETEQDLINPHYWLSNNGALVDLYKQINQMMLEFGFTPLMKCGHVANARTGNNEPVCVVCLGIRPGATEVETVIPLFEDRFAKCTYCGRTAPSSLTLPFFCFNKSNSFDEYYCGCRGWD